MEVNRKHKTGGSGIYTQKLDTLLTTIL